MTLRSLLALPLLLGALVLAARADPPGDGFAPLFPNGRLDGWKTVNWNDLTRAPGNKQALWTLRDGVLASDGSGTWLISPREYGDFTLRLDAKVAPGANGGVAVRFPLEGDPAFRGLEIQVIDAESEAHKTIGPAHKTGAVYDELVPGAAAKPAGEWNGLEITCRGPRLTVVLNGKTAVDADLSKETTKRGRGVSLAERPRRGHIGFQNINGAVSYRNVRIKALD